MLRAFLTRFFIATLFCLVSMQAQGNVLSKSSSQVDYSQTTDDKLYEQAKFYYNELQTNSSLAKSRESWLKGTRNFRKLYLLNPNSDLAPSCLFMLGRMYRHMHENFKLGIDLDESLSNFTELTQQFPEHKLADDAHLAIGLIYLKQKQDPQKAATSFESVVTRFPEGDMRGTATEQLKLLSKDFDIPLPKILITNSQAEELNTVLPIKFWSSQDYTRIVVMAAGPITYTETLVDEKTDQPRLFYIDFKNSYIEPQHRSPTTVQDGLLRQIRTRQFSADTVRLEIRVKSLDSYKIFSLPEPFRVVIDIRGKSESSPIVTKKVELSIPRIDAEAEPISITKSTSQPLIQENLQVTAIRSQKKKRVFQQKASSIHEGAKNALAHQPISLAQQLGLGVKKIVLDPGHGGKDPGAMANGMQEKDIVLKIAQELRPVLMKELGCEVVLTRDSDVFLPLEDRTAIANTQEADLFISLHINAHPSTKVRGTETYFLNFSTNADAMRVAAIENATSTHQMSDLEDILSDIMKTSKIDESSRLAQHVHSAILSGIDQETFGKAKNLGVKQAPFYVLIGADMPAILLEVAFISNEDDAKNLQNPKFIASLTKEIATGVRSYIQINTASLDIR